VYEVQEILKVRTTCKGKRLQYLVQWRGYPPEERTCELREHLEGAEGALADYYAKYPNTPKEVKDKKGRWRVAGSKPRGRPPRR
jgi:hypothetical protein